jgi:late competence protein required for DNA uptake (superfamily II DNA/RNA helicase)
MKCQRCNREITEEQGYPHAGETLCEDCYLDIRFPAKACDPWAVYSATRTRDQSGLKGTEGLTDLQKEMHAFVKKNGKVTPEEMMKRFDLSVKEMQTQMAMLRHCELIKGQKDGDKIYLVPFKLNGEGQN